MALQAQLWSLNALSTELDRDRRSLARRLQDLTPDEQVKHAGRQIKRWWLRRVLAHLDAQTTTALDLNQERARLAKIQAEKIEYEVARLRGTLIDAKAVERVWSRVIVDLRTRLLGADPESLNWKEPKLLLIPMSNSTTKLIFNRCKY